MSSEKSSTSEALRKAGNEIYSQVRDGCYGPCVLRLKLGKAHKLYQEALKAADRDKSERASSYKNLAAVNWLWGKSEWQIYMKESEGSSEALQAIREAKERISKSLKFYILALELGESGAKPEIWVTKLQEIVEEIIVWVEEQLDTYSVCFESILVDLCVQMDNAGSNSSQSQKVLASVFYMIHAAFIFNEGFKNITNEDGDERRIEESGYKRCLNAIKECHLPLRKAEGIVYSTNDNVLIKEFQNLKEQVLLYEFICESIQARWQGDAILERALLEDEAVSRELVWDAIDWYRHSVLLSKEKDPEGDAIALSRIGKVYSSVLKSEKLAYRYHLESTKIAQEIMCPRIAESEWYKYSSLKVQQHQIEQEETAVRIEKTINVIKMEGEKSSQSFLNFIYREHNHPDPKKGRMGKIDTPVNVKAALRKAIQAYHPDSNGCFHQDWKILCEEITKILNCKYKFFK